MSWKAKSKPAPYPLCWWCNRQFIAGARVWSKIEIHDREPTPLVVFVHKNCAAKCLGDVPGAAVIEESK